MSARTAAFVVVITLALALGGPAASPARAANGCGPAGFGLLVPDHPLGYDFTGACARHDDCYTTPWRELAPSRAAAKLGCDTAFLADLEDACVDGADAGLTRHLALCLEIAVDYHRAVRSWLGDLAYGRAQL